MLDPYENILIGNFLYSLGARTAIRCAQLGLEVQGSICLLQQTPLDGVLGDVCLQYPGTIRILEFKRSGNHSPKESNKLSKLRIALQGTESRGLEVLSRKVHWYVESIEATPVWLTKARPYLDMETSCERDLNIGQLTEHFVQAAVGDGKLEFSAEDIARYLKDLATYAGSKGTSSSGIVVAVDSTGVVRWLPLESVRELRMDLAQRKAYAKQMVAEMGVLREQALQAERQREMKHVHERRLERTQDQEQSR